MSVGAFYEILFLTSGFKGTHQLTLDILESLQQCTMYLC